MSAKRLFNSIRLSKSEAAWVLVLVALLLLCIGIGDIRARRRAGAPVHVVKGDRARFTYDIDLNSANWAELTLLPGVGEVTAKRIVALREKLGGFTSVEQIKEVRGLGDVRVAEIAKYVTLGTEAKPKE
ncbi:MAG: helix-hairpin-helix domain-containing protein [Planctomycetes bacterium]|nr:helix-hairpin-helix domain-containing protein [Planctomycetota bacterium]